MARRCTCDRLLEALETDPRLSTLPAVPRLLWLLLAHAMARAAVPGILAFGSAVRIALLVRMPETEVETGLETLLGEQLLTRTDGGGLACPLLVDVSARAAAARINGQNGGRRRKGETLEEMRARKQGNLMLPLPGRSGETQGTQGLTEGDAAPTTTTDTHSVVSGRVSAVAPERAVIGEEVALLAGLDPVRQRFDYKPIEEWIAAGATRAVILAGVQATMERPTYQASRVHSLRYFRDEVLARIPVVATPSVSGWAEAFAAHIRHGGDATRFPTKAAWLAQQQQAA